MSNPSMERQRRSGAPVRTVQVIKQSFNYLSQQLSFLNHEQNVNHQMKLEELTKISQEMSHWLKQSLKAIDQCWQKEYTTLEQNGYMQKQQKKLRENLQCLNADERKKQAQFNLKWRKQTFNTTPYVFKGFMNQLSSYTNALFSYSIDSSQNNQYMLDIFCQKSAQNSSHRAVKSYQEQQVQKMNAQYQKLLKRTQFATSQKFKLQQQLRRSKEEIYQLHQKVKHQQQSIVQLVEKVNLLKMLNQQGQLFIDAENELGDGLFYKQGLQDLTKETPQLIPVLERRNQQLGQLLDYREKQYLKMKNQHQNVFKRNEILERSNLQLSTNIKIMEYQNGKLKEKSAYSEKIIEYNTNEAKEHIQLEQELFDYQGDYKRKLNQTQKQNSQLRKKNQELQLELAKTKIQPYLNEQPEEQSSILRFFEIKNRQKKNKQPENQFRNESLIKKKRNMLYERLLSDFQQKMTNIYSLFCNESKQSISI